MAKFFVGTICIGMSAPPLLNFIDKHTDTFFLAYKIGHLIVSFELAVFFLVFNSEHCDQQYAIYVLTILFALIVVALP